MEADVGSPSRAGESHPARTGRGRARREDNLQVYRQVSAFFERRPGVGDPERSPVPFACECGASGCDLGVRVTLAEARGVFEAGPGRRLAAAEHAG
jgi:hypothetical protein